VLDDGEKVELRALGERLSRDRVRYLRNRAFDLVREHWAQPDAAPLAMLHWLEQVVKTLDASADPPPVEAHA
jgi:mitochondrial cardiolipin hydrolase